jgi:hypothetical protein
LLIATLKVLQPPLFSKPPKVHLELIHANHPLKRFGREPVLSPRPLICSVRQQSERCHCPCVIGNPITAITRESKEDRAIFTATLSDSRNAAASWALSDDAVFEPRCFNTKVAVFANCFAANNPTALKVNGDRMVATLRTTKVVGNEDFGDKFVKSFERFNDAFAALIKSVKFAVGVAHRGNDLSALVNSLKQ